MYFISFIGVIMAVLGIPIALRKERGAGIALGLAFCFLISLAYLVSSRRVWNWARREFSPLPLCLAGQFHIRVGRCLPLSLRKALIALSHKQISFQHTEDQ